MTVKEIREALHKHPFEPFRLVLTDGTERQVPHRDFVAVARRRVAVFDSVTDALSILDPLHIISIEYAGKNRKRPRSRPGEGGSP